MWAKAAVDKRLNRIIKTKIGKYIKNRRNMRCVNLIQDMGDAFNYSRHRSIGIAHANVYNRNKYPVWMRPFGDSDTHHKLPILQKAIMHISSHNKLFSSATCSTKLKITLQWVRQCHLTKILRGLYRSWYNTIIQISK